MILPLRLPTRAVEVHCTFCGEPIPEGDGVFRWMFFGLDRPEVDVIVHRDPEACKAALA